MNPSYLVVWCNTRQRGLKKKDHYETCESLEAAQKKYDALLTKKRPSQPTSAPWLPVRTTTRTHFWKD